MGHLLFLFILLTFMLWCALFFEIKCRSTHSTDFFLLNKKKLKMSKFVEHKILRAEVLRWNHELQWVEFQNNSRKVFCVSGSDGVIRIYVLPQLKLIRKLSVKKFCSAANKCMLQLAKTHYLASGHFDGHIYIWNFMGGKICFPPFDLPSAISALHELPLEQKVGNQKTGSSSALIVAGVESGRIYFLAWSVTRKSYLGFYDLTTCCATEVKYRMTMKDSDIVHIIKRSSLFLVCSIANRILVLHLRCLVSVPIEK